MRSVCTIEKPVGTWTTLVVETQELIKRYFPEDEATEDEVEHVRVRKNQRAWIPEVDRDFSSSELRRAIREMNAPGIEGIPTRTFKAFSENC